MESCSCTCASLLAFFFALSSVVLSFPTAANKFCIFSVDFSQISLHCSTVSASPSSSKCFIILFNTSSTAQGMSEAWKLGLWKEHSKSGMLDAGENETKRRLQIHWYQSNNLFADN